jgi:hypothetical protein
VVNFAYDNLTDFDIRQLKFCFDGMDEHDLIFDEWPYKAYKAKVKSPVELKYIGFEEIDSNGKRRTVYKGEGVVTFVLYSPYAIETDRSTWKKCPNYIEWADEIDTDDNYGEMPFYFSMRLDNFSTTELEIDNLVYKYSNYSKSYSCTSINDKSKKEVNVLSNISNYKVADVKIKFWGHPNLEKIIIPSDVRINSLLPSDTNVSLPSAIFWKLNNLHTISLPYLCDKRGD